MPLPSQGNRFPFLPRFRHSFGTVSCDLAMEGRDEAQADALAEALEATLHVEQEEEESADTSEEEWMGNANLPTEEVLRKVADTCRHASQVPDEVQDDARREVMVAWDERMLEHKPEEGEFHFERPARVSSILEKLESEDLSERLLRVPSRTATDDELRLCHGEQHIRLVEESFALLQAEESNGDDDPDMYWSRGTALAARLAAGCMVEVTKQSFNGESSRGFAIVRPPGHHACECKAMGFCFFNNVAIAAKDAVESGLAKRVVILDWDVHHGNGTQDILEEDPNILYVSLHRFGGGFYPGTGDCTEVGKGDGKGFSVNIPFEKGMKGCDYIAAMRLIVLPICYSFNPDLVLISAGFDAAKGDPLGEMKLRPDDYGIMTHLMMELAGGRVVVALEGGYSLDNCANCSHAVIQSLLEERTFKLKQAVLHPTTRSTLLKVIKQQSEFWPIFQSTKFLSMMEGYFDGCFRRNARKSMAQQLLEEYSTATGYDNLLSNRTRRSPRAARAVAPEASESEHVKAVDDLDSRLEVTLRETAAHLRDVATSINALQGSLSSGQEESTGDATAASSESTDTAFEQVPL